MVKQTKTTLPAVDIKAFPTVQITYMTRTAIGKLVENYGIHGSPPKDTACLLICVNGDEGNKYVIPLSAQTRQKNLKEGEFVTGNFKIGSIIFFDEEGNINITSKGELNATVEGDTTITTPNLNLNGNLIVDGTIEATDTITSDVDCISDGISGKGHTHPQGADSHGSVEVDTGAPI